MKENKVTGSRKAAENILESQDGRVEMNLMGGEREKAWNSPRVG